MPKYNNKKTHRIIKGETVTFDSKLEARVYDRLNILQKAGHISELELQPKFLLLDTLRVEGHRTIPKKYYIADFKYKEKGKTVIADAKGMKTSTYQLKKHLFLEKYGHLYTFKEIMK